MPGEGLDDLHDVLLAAEEDGTPLVQMLGHQLQDGLPANSKGESERWIIKASRKRSADKQSKLMLEALEAPLADSRHN